MAESQRKLKPSKRWSKEHYVQLEAWVVDYQAGDTAAAEKIIESYSDFIGSYVNLIKTGNCNIVNHSQRHFLAMFASRYLPENLQAQKDPDPYNVNVQHAFYGAAQWLAGKFHLFSNEEIQNELIIGLLEMAVKYKRYKPEGAYFHTYIQKAFHYTANKRLSQILRNPLVFDWEENIEFDEDGVADPTGRPFEELVWEGVYQLRPYGMDPADYNLRELDDNWVNGYNCDELFSDLSPIDRQILDLRYAKGFKDTEIADMFGWGRRTISKRRLAIKRHLMEKGGKLTV